MFFLHFSNMLGHGKVILLNDLNDSLDPCIKFLILNLYFELEYQTGIHLNHMINQTRILFNTVVVQGFIRIVLLHATDCV